MEIRLKNTPEQVELVKAMGSKNLTVAREAAEAVAAFLVPVIKEVLLTAGTASRIYRDIEFDEDTEQSIPLDLFYNEGAGYITIWSQNVAGGLPSSQVEGVKELKFGTYRLDSAVSWNKKYARKSRLDVISKSIERMVNELVIKQERNAWAVVLKALAEASTKTVDGTSRKHILASTTADVFILDDLNKLITRIKRINESFSGNTPVQPFSNGITDLFVSPEIKEKIRAFAYNPINTTASAGSGAEARRDQFLTDDLRNAIWQNAGMQSIFGINIIEMIEFGISQKYNVLFNSFTTGQNVPGSNSGAWNGAGTDEILVGVDNTRGVLLRPVSRQADSGGTISVLPDGQWDGYGSRVEKQGFYTFLEEGRLCVDARALAGVAV